MVTCGIWIPFNLLSYYPGDFLSEDQAIFQSERVYMAVVSLLQVLQTAVVMILVKEPGSAPLGCSLREGVFAWVPLLVTRIVLSIIIVVGLLLLVVPGIYMWVRLMYIEAATVIERRSVSRSIARSMEMTSGKFWPSFGLAVILVAFAIPGVLVLGLTELFLTPDYWIAAATIDVIYDLCFSLMVVGFVCGYRRMAIPETPA